jgi:hypothetical protein
MDQAHLSAAGQQLVAALAPRLAHAAGTTSADQAGDPVQRALALLSRQFQGNRRAEAALTVFEDEPGDPQSQARLLRQIVACFGEQPDAIAELTNLVRQLQAAPGGTPSQQRSITVRDQAQVGTAIAGDVQGSLIIGATSFGDQVGGDKISGDITTGDVSSTGGAIGHKGQAQVDQRDREAEE